MTRNPEAGDIIRINGKKGELLVTEAGVTVEGDNHAGATFTWFNAVGMKTADPITGAIDGSKEKKYYTMVSGIDYPVTPLSDIHLVATAKFKKEVTVKYFIKKVKE